MFGLGRIGSADLVGQLDVDGWQAQLGEGEGLAVGGHTMRAFFACMYYAGMRPAEVSGLHAQDCHLPKRGWGRLVLTDSRPQTNKRWTDSGEAHDTRGLKHRATQDTRPVPIPPELVAIIREHLDEFGAAEDGRLFRTRTGATHQLRRLLAGRPRPGPAPPPGRLAPRGPTVRPAARGRLTLAQRWGVRSRGGRTRRTRR